MSYLPDSSPIQSSRPIPEYLPHPFSPTKKRYQALLDRPPQTEREKELQRALWEARGREEAHKGFLAGMQATTILQGMYLKRTHTQLQAQEGNAKSKRSKKVLGDGLPKLLDGDKSYAKIVQAEGEATRKAAQKKQRKREGEQHADLLAKWKKLEAERKARNKDRRAKFRPQLKAWERERDRAKKEERRPGWARPKLSGIEPPIPKPRASVNDDESVYGDNSEDENNEGEQQEDEEGEEDNE